MDNRIIWVVVGVGVVVAMLFAGFLPLPGQKDNATPLTQPAPAGQSPEPTRPGGPPEQKVEPKAQTK